MMKTKFNTKLLTLLLIWVFATVINLDKAYHIDDTVHLETAQWILQAPLRPMSGQINWDQNTEPIHVLNQPHLYFYMLAAWGKLWGFGEVQTHIFQSLFTLACIILIYLIAKVIIPSRAIFFTALLTLSPAFVVGQNLMVDIPILSFWLAFFYLIIKPQVKSEGQRFAWAGFAAGCACLIKYSSLPLIPVMAAYLIIRKQFHLLWTVAIPVIMLILWSYFNYLDYGSIHIFGRSSRPFSLKLILEMGLSFLVCLGAVLPYSPIYLRNFWHTKKVMKLLVPLSIILILIASFAVIAGVYFGKIDQRISNGFFLLVFFGNGIALTILLIKNFLGTFRTRFTQLPPPILLLYLWLGFGVLFILIPTPFMATRHVLLVIVPISLLLAYFIKSRASFAWDITVLILTTLLTLFLGISDRIWANFYREKAALIRSELPKEANVYFSGHWGWQWYAKQNNMTQIEAFNPQVQPGDYLVYPEGISQQKLDNIPLQFSLKVVKKYSNRPSFFTFFSTRGDARFYISDFRTAPWIVTWRPIPPIVVYRVEASARQSKNPIDY